MANSLKSLASKLKAMRVVAELSQEAMAARLGITQGTYSQYEKGQVDFPFSKLQALASALGVTVADLMVEDKPVAAPPRAPTEKEMTMAVLKKFGLAKNRLEAIGLILDADDDDVGSVIIGLKRNLRASSKGETSAG